MCCSMHGYRSCLLYTSLDGKDYYLVYEKSDIQDWVFLGLAQADIVNASMNTLQLSTMLLVGAVVLCPIMGLIITDIIEMSTIMPSAITSIMMRFAIVEKIHIIIYLSLIHI